MIEVLETIEARHSTRTAFDPEHKVPKEDLLQILEAARWAPTAHNMQNFEIIVVDDPQLLAEIGEIQSSVSKAFIRENYRQLSFSTKELRSKKTGLLASRFSRSWTTPDEKPDHLTTPLSRTIQGSPVVLIVLYDAKKRAPASKGDALGMMSLGCLLENMWLIAESLHIGLHVMSAFGAPTVEHKLRSLLGIPTHFKIGFACALGYPVATPSKYVRVRRELGDFTRYNGFRSKGLPWLD